VRIKGRIPLGGNEKRLPDGPVPGLASQSAFYGPDPRITVVFLICCGGIARRPDVYAASMTGRRRGEVRYGAQFHSASLCRPWRHSPLPWMRRAGSSDRERRRPISLSPRVRTSRVSLTDGADHQTGRRYRPQAPRRGYELDPDPHAAGLCAKDPGAQDREAARLRESPGRVRPPPAGERGYGRSAELIGWTAKPASRPRHVRSYVNRYDPQAHKGGQILETLKGQPPSGCKLQILTFNRPANQQ
jgi:hypothetical protein